MDMIQVIRAGNFWMDEKCHDAKNVDLLKQFSPGLLFTLVKLSVHLK